MRSIFAALHGPLPFVGALAVAGTFAPTVSAPEPGEDPASDQPAIINVQRGQRRFTTEDIPLIVAHMRRLGIVNFVCSMDPVTGNMTVETDEVETPHLDLKPGECPNNLEVEGNDVVGTLRGGVLGNNFDVTQVDLDTLRMAVDTFVGDVVVEPTSVTFGDVGTPFVAELCDCHGLEGDQLLDIVADFDRDEVIEAFGLGNLPTGERVALQVSGMLQRGVAIFAARDCVRIVNN